MFWQLCNVLGLPTGHSPTCYANMVPNTLKLFGFTVAAPLHDFHGAHLRTVFSGCWQSLPTKRYNYINFIGWSAAHRRVQQGVRSNEACYQLHGFIVVGVVVLV